MKNFLVFIIFLIFFTSNIVFAEKDKISVYHKGSKCAGFGGFAFGIKAYKNPSDHAVLPENRKLGELTDKKGNLYNIVLKHPEDVQYDYTKSEEMPKSFKLLYESGENINITGVNGSEYFKNQGMKGADLYNEILEKHKIALIEKYTRFNFIPINSIKTSEKLNDKYNPKKDYFDYSVVLEEFPKNYYYTTVKINKSKERILIITDKVNDNNNSNHGLFYYFAKNGFVYPLGLIVSKTPLAQSKKYLYYNNGNKDIKFYMSDKKLETIKSAANTKEERNSIKFVTIKSADKYDGDFGEPAGDDIKKAAIDGFYFEYHKGQYKKQYIKNLMKECIKDGVKTQVQMYCCMVKKLHN